MMERAESGQKLYTSMRLWEFPDQYIIEPTDGSSSSPLSISRIDASMNLIDGVPESNSLRVPKILTIFGVIGMLKLVAGSYLIVIAERERAGSYLGHPIFKVTSLKIFPCDHSLKNSPAEQKRLETEFSRLLNIAESTSGLYFSYDTNLTLSAQRLHDLGDESKLLPLWRQAEPRFLWNNYMLEVLIENKVGSLLFIYHFYQCFEVFSNGLVILYCCLFCSLILSYFLLFKGVFRTFKQPLGKILLMLLFLLGDAQGEMALACGEEELILMVMLLIL
uniref:Phosphoinositide phosphatase family protein n=1 Tax=Rhizophora mucronata TaxID=61149 RepID=A0A2P2M2C7_RHIMU